MLAFDVTKMKLTNNQIRSALIALQGLPTTERTPARLGLLQYKLTSLRANWNIGRTHKSLTAASAKIDEQVKELFKTCFGDEQSVKSDHPRFGEYQNLLATLGQEETEVEKIWRVKLDELATVPGSEAVAGDVLSALEFMIEEESTQAV